MKACSFLTLAKLALVLSPLAAFAQPIGTGSVGQPVSLTIPFGDTSYNYLPQVASGTINRPDGSVFMHVPSSWQPDASVPTNPSVGASGLAGPVAFYDEASGRFGTSMYATFTPDQPGTWTVNISVVIDPLGGGNGAGYVYTVSVANPAPPPQPDPVMFTVSGNYTYDGNSHGAIIDARSYRGYTLTSANYTVNSGSITTASNAGTWNVSQSRPTATAELSEESGSVE